MYDQNSGLDSDDATEFSKKAILFEECDINRLVIAGTEKLNHFISKAIMFYILREMNHDVVTECTIVGVGRLDIYDITTKAIYEFEASSSINKRRKENEIYAQSGVEVIIVDVRKLPDDIFQRYMKLKEYAIPD